MKIDENLEKAKLNEFMLNKKHLIKSVIKDYF